ncbi:MAG: hypothetical protein M3069_21980, partial [Chloroflexota bacterium]|nr:hypothetical protein [Chloroflexota bacterium]
SDGFAQAIGGDEASYEQPLAAFAEQVLDVARQRGCPSLRLRAAAAGRTRATLLFRVASEETTALEIVAAGAGARPDAVRLTTMSAGTVRWDQEWATVRPRPVADAPDRPTVDLFPIGLTGDRRVLYGERSSGPILVAGLASAGVWTLLSALVVDRLRRQSPRDLAVIAIARDDRLDPLLADAPQLRAAFVDPADSVAVNQALADIDEQLHRRLETGNVDLPDVVLVVDEWAELPDCGPTLDLLAHHGASVGMHLIAATAQADDPRLERGVGLFGTRLVLQVPDESASARLLGQAGAEELDRLGQALPFVDGEVLPRVRGFCVPPLHVQHLVAGMRAQVEQDSNPSIFDDMRGDAEQHSSNTDEDVPGEREIELQDESAETVVIHDRPAAQPATAFQQVPLMPAVPMTPRPASAPTSASVSAKPPVSVEVFGQDRITALEHELASADGVSWELFRIVSCLPPGKASLARVAALKYPSDLDRKAAIQRLRQNKSNLQKAWATVIGDDNARRILTLDSGVLWLAPDLVKVDVHTFLAAIYDGNRARQEQRLEDAIAAYSRAMTLYAGPLLAGRDEDYEWLAQSVEGPLTLREGYRRQERMATERLAELLVATNRPGEAASLYADLMRDPGPPDVEADELEQFVFRQYAFREECARAVFECCRLTRDLPGLERSYRELCEVLHALAADAGVPAGCEGTEPGAVTQARYKAIWAELNTRGAATTAGD